jgi:hypothetical protein
MLREAVANVRVDLPEGHARIPEIEVLLPALAGSFFQFLA